MCAQQYFLSYVLGLPDPGGIKADKGTIVHKALECLAQAKKVEQDNGVGFKDDVLGEIEVKTDAMWDETWIDWLIDASYDYYTKNSPHKFTDGDRRDCRKWTWKALNFNKGIFDPRKQNVVEAEPKFDITINEPWAEYDYIMPDGSRMHGNLAVKGTIDLITCPKDGVYESIDWKTGMRKCWITGETKDFWKLGTDPQLRIYHYAMSKMYPDIKQFIPSIYFINKGGPFTMPFGPSDIAATEEMLRKRFEEIKAVTRPQLLTGYSRWKCNKFCHYGMTEHSSGTINPRTGEPHTICSYIADKTRKQGIDTVIAEDTAKDHNIDFYQDPGL